MGFCAEDGGMEIVKRGLEATVSRGPDDSRIIDLKRGVLGFQRLSSAITSTLCQTVTLSSDTTMRTCSS